MARDINEANREKTDITTILVPIRYPLTAQSTQTLEYAKQIARDHKPSDLRILHVNLIQNNTDARKEEITRAISPLLDEIKSSVSVQRGFLVEEVIFKEGSRVEADIVVLGKNKKPRWRQVLSRAVGNDPAIDRYLQQNIDAQIEVV